MDVNQTCVPADILIGIIVAIWLAFEEQKYRFFKSVASIQHIQRPFYVLLLKDKP